MSECGRPCECGHSPEEHGHDIEHPGSTACTEDGCPCIAFDAIEWTDE